MAIGTILSLAILGSLGFLATQQAIDRSLEQRQVLARTTAANLEGVMEQNLRILSNFRGPLPNGEDPGQVLVRADLRDLYFQTIFDDGIYLMDVEGSLLAWEPQAAHRDQEDFLSNPEIQRAMNESRIVVSSAYHREPGKSPVVSAVVPIRDRFGKVTGWLEGAIDLTGPKLTQIIGPASPGETGHVEVVDSAGVVLASTRPDLLLTESDHGQVLGQLIAEKESTVRTCHNCHIEVDASERETEVMAFTPLTTIPWGVGIRQPESEVLAPVRSLQRRFLFFGGLLLLVNFTLAYGISRGVVNPIRTLTTAARRLAEGDLAESIPPLGKDEVGVLGTSLETMRQRLEESLQTIREWNSVLEARVAERTHQLEEAQKDRELLLQRSISAQEEERKRVARELHDDVSQNIASLALALDRAAQSQRLDSDFNGHLVELQALAVRTVDGIRRIILDLRPSVLDDLGLIAAVRWYAENRLGQDEVRVHWDLPEEERRLPPTLELSLFRVAQEAISNIARHAGAENVIIALELSEDEVELRFEDDGKGFDTSEVLGADRRMTALGILGMQERIAMLEGVLTIDSHPGGGTVLSARVPLALRESEHNE